MSLSPNNATINNIIKRKSFKQPKVRKSIVYVNKTESRNVSPRHSVLSILTKRNNT